MAATNSKVICIDITGHCYIAEVNRYINSGVNEIDYVEIEKQISVRYKAINKDIEEGGNYKVFKEHLTTRNYSILA